MTDDKTINVTAINDKIEYHLGEAKKLQDALNVLLSVDDTLPKQQPTKSITFTREAIPSLKFKDVVVREFKKENTPLTTKESRERYNKETGKDLSYYAFSAQFSSLVTKGIIKKHTFSDNPIETRFYYGLPEWFEEGTDNLKEEYIQALEVY